MQISVNGEEMEVSPGFTIGKLLTETTLEEGDKLEIVKAIGGG